MPAQTSVSIPACDFRQLYKRHATWVYALVFHIVRDSAVAANLVNEVFWRVWNEPRILAVPPRSVDAWVRVVARKAAIDYLRSPESLASLSHNRAFMAEQIAHHQLCIGELSRIHTAIEKLPQHQRTVLELVYFENMSYAEIAGIVGRPLGTVKTWGRSADFRLAKARAIGAGIRTDVNC